jgi:uncharacterized membrane protein YeiH
MSGHPSEASADIGLFGNWTLGDFVIIDLIAATTNAFNGALLARQPSHYRAYTVVGILLIAIIGGIGGGVTRDILLNDVPSALTNPWYLILCIVAALLALRIASAVSPGRLAAIFDFMAIFSLPWYAAVGVNKALGADLPYIGCILIGVVGPTAGRYFIDITSDVTPMQFVRGEWFVGTAIVTSVVYIIADQAFHLTIWPATLIAFAVGFAFRFIARRYRLEEPLPNDRAGNPVLAS